MKAVVLVVAATALVVWIDTLLAARPGEPGVLRWMRTCAAHPLRTGLALLLLSLALRPGGWPLGNAPTRVYDDRSPPADAPGRRGPRRGSRLPAP